MRMFCVFIFSVLMLAADSYADEAVILEKIVVKPDAGDRDGYPVELINGPGITQRHPDAAPEILSEVSGVDLRQRGAFGIQADLSIRGATFEENSVSIDGIKVNDPQTGHFSLDLPLTVYDLAAVTVNKTGDSVRYGAGALAGSVDFKTAKPAERYFKADAFFGEHALFGQAFSLGLPLNEFSSRFSLEHTISKAARPDTDFEYYIASLYLNRDFDSSNIDSFFGYQKKDFGADSFYSNLFPEEEEHTETYFARIGFDTGSRNARLKNDIYVRRHKDKFILRRNNPTSVNYHTNYIYGLNSGLNFDLGASLISAGLDIGNDLINSTNLGVHSRTHGSGFIGFATPVGGRLNADLGVRFDHYQKWGGFTSYNTGAAYNLVDGRLKAKGAYSRAFRLPSFTELYYSDAANRGNPDLEREVADNFTLGLEYKKGCLGIELEGFLRRGHNLIDYTRATVNDIWQATNLGRVDFSGTEAAMKLHLSNGGRLFDLKDLSFSYAYQAADRKAEGFLSKYALDILQNRALLGLFTGIFGVDVNLQLSYNQRYYGDTFITGDFYIGKKIESGALTMEPFVKVDNFTDANMVDVGGVLLPGRWVRSGIKFEW